MVDRLRTLLVAGTRPELIKMAPVIRHCIAARDQFEPLVCFTGQHREMLQQVAEYFGIVADVDLELMQFNQSLASLTAAALGKLDQLIVDWQPGCVVAQGDTTTVLAASMAAFYRRTPFVHVEAGLRTYNLQAPWPEEYNRRVASLTADLHCAPTRRAAEQLLAEGCRPDCVHITGNTVVDALQWTIQRERQRSQHWSQRHPYLADRRTVLITGHRRESFGPRFESICYGIADLSQQFPDVMFVYPVHLNPNVREPVYRILSGLANVRLTAPLAYPEFVWMMDRSCLILTDSGGVQEEAPSLRKPVLVMRDNTERPEAVEAGAVQLIGTRREKLVEAVGELLSDATKYQQRTPRQNPYGDGQAAPRIVQLIRRQFAGDLSHVEPRPTRAA